MRSPEAVKILAILVQQERGTGKAYGMLPTVTFLGCDEYDQVSTNQCWLRRDKSSSGFVSPDWNKM